MPTRPGGYGPWAQRGRNSSAFVLPCSACSAMFGFVPPCSAFVRPCSAVFRPSERTNRYEKAACVNALIMRKYHSCMNHYEKDTFPKCSPRYPFCSASIQCVPPLFCLVPPCLALFCLFRLVAHLFGLSARSAGARILQTSKIRYYLFPNVPKERRKRPSNS